jgi:hypothetical protein
VTLQLLSGGTVLAAGLLCATGSRADRNCSSKDSGPKTVTIVDLVLKDHVSSSSKIIKVPKTACFFHSRAMTNPGCQVIT